MKNKLKARLDPFRLDQIMDPTTSHAVISTAGHKTNEARWDEPPPASYGIGLAGGGVLRKLWGGGYARYPVPMLGYGLARLLGMGWGTQRLVVHANQGLADALAHFERSPHRPVQAGELLRAISEALAQDRFELRPFRKGNEPPGFGIAHMVAEEGLSATRPRILDLLKDGTWREYEVLLTDEGAV